MGVIVKDIIFNDDLEILGGDFRVLPSDEQHIEHILRTWLGHWKEFPLLGVGIDLFRASAGKTGKLKTDIVTQLTKDGYQINKVVVNIEDGNPQFFLDFTRIKNGNL
jgi:hypothetical protein